jgi:hypothetical protein
MGIDVASGLLSHSSGMNTNPAEIMAKPRFEESTRGGIERLARFAQHIMHDRRRRHGPSHVVHCLPLHHRTGEPGPVACGSGITYRHPHYLVRHAIRFLFIHIARLIDR